ncbi:Hexosaminidase D [Nymphon striatum]|nr:Hexosaminidase D [Nymphon striatum]
MIFYRRGCLSFMIITSVSFIFGMFFHRSFFCNRIVLYSPLEVPNRGFQNDIYPQAVKMVTKSNNVEDVEPVIMKRSMSSVAKSSFHKKLVHLDLKGAPPKISYLESLLPLLKKQGATGLIIEYEDSFPFEGEIYELSSTKPYYNASILGFDIIPLVQTFGHMEFALKLPRFKKLRENSLYPNNLLKEIISQVVSFHKEFRIKQLHIGCDEVYHLAECEICSKSACQYMCKVYTGLTPIIWDDMLRKIPEETIRVHNVQDVVEIMVWNYHPHFRHKMWAASSFKGATGVDQMMTSPQYHLRNHKIWMETAFNHSHDFSFKGIALTGWQRYDHFSVMCELLPVAIPSLISNLRYLNNPDLSDEQLIDEVRDALKCNNPLPLDIPNSTFIAECSFPGSSIYKSILEVYNLNLNYFYIIKNSHMAGWMTSYQVLNSYSNPDHVRLAMRGIRGITQRYAFLATSLPQQLSEIYEQETIDEWYFMYFGNIKSDLRKLEWHAEKLMSQTTWPRRYFSHKDPVSTI